MIHGRSPETNTDKTLRTSINHEKICWAIGKNGQKGIIMKMNHAKVLYFEGAGMSIKNASKNFIDNYRIRTAFHLDDGRAVYLELTGTERTKRSNPDIYKWQYTGFVDTVYYITDDIPNDDCNKHRIVLPGEEECGGWIAARTMEYSKEAVLQYVNSLGASFDAIVVLPDLGGYRVFPEKKSCKGPDGYYYGDKFQYDPELTAQREKVYSFYYDLEKSEGKAYPNFSLWVDEFDPGLLHLLRHFNGYNKHWNIRFDGDKKQDEKFWTEQEATLGKYAC